MSLNISRKEKAAKSPLSLSFRQAVEGNSFYGLFLWSYTETTLRIGIWTCAKTIEFEAGSEF
jgi:hypothetical protein